MHDYSIEDLKKALNFLKIKKNDNIYCHSNIGYFGIMKETRDKDKICKKIYNCIKNVIGKKGTLIVPTYSYSFSKKRNGIIYRKKEDFDLKKTKSTMGVFSEWIRKNPNSLRSIDPFFSSAVIGHKKKFFTENLSNNSFDENSLFSKLLKLNVKFLNFNFNGYTFIHFIERKLNVKYRFNKKFYGEIVLNKKKKINWYIFVRYLYDKKFVDNHMPLINHMKDYNLIRTYNVGRGEISTTNAEKIYKTIRSKIKKNGLYLTGYNKGVK